MLVLNWLIAGTDAHAKNYSMILRGTKTQLAPLYDIASALPSPEWNWHKWELAMRINKQGRFKYLTSNDWIKFTAAVHVDSDVTERAIAEYRVALPQAIIDVSNSMNLDTEQAAFVERLVAEIKTHINRIT
jgi:serine/threonine-protein kinase HipA